MLPNTQELANQLSVLAELHPEMTVSELAAALAISPIFVVNALAVGVREKMFEHDQPEDMIKITSPMEFGKSIDIFGPEIDRIAEEILVTIENLNVKEEDIEEGKLISWCRGIRPSAVEIALFALERTGYIAKYDLKDPKDEKSVYTFYTLPDNADNFWGLKQFKEK